MRDAFWFAEFELSWMSVDKGERVLVIVLTMLLNFESKVKSYDGSCFVEN